MFKEFLESINSFANKASFGISQNSPQILLVGGGIGVIVGTFLACKATHEKLGDVLDEHQEQLDAIKEDQANEEITEQEAAKKITRTYARTCIKIARIYVKPVGIIAVSLAGMCASNDILRRRNMRFAAAYASLDALHKNYRGRVIERFGEEVDKELMTNTHEEKIDETYVDEKGKEKKRKKSIKVADPGAENDYMRYFTRTNPNWENDPDYVEMFIRAQQNYANDLLRVKGFVALNEVYRALGFEENLDNGLVCGWRRKSDDPLADGYIKFDVYDVCLPNEYGEYERAYAIDFNVDGCIKEERKKRGVRK